MHAECRSESLMLYEGSVQTSPQSPWDRCRQKISKSFNMLNSTQTWTTVSLVRNEKSMLYIDGVGVRSKILASARWSTRVSFLFRDRRGILALSVGVERETPELLGAERKPIMEIQLQHSLGGYKSKMSKEELRGMTAKHVSPFT